MEKKGITDVHIFGIDNNRPFTTTLSITLEGKFLPMQLIYKEKTTLSLPKVKLLEGLS